MGDPAKTPLELLRDYRDKVENDIIEDEKTYNTTITYIAAGALGLILTINEKFFHITDARGRVFLFGSIILLLITLILYISNTIIGIKANDTIRNKADEMLATSIYDDAVLSAIWQEQFKKTRFWDHLRFVLLIAGVIAEIVFILLNIFPAQPVDRQNESNKIKIEIRSLKDSNSLFIDSSHKQVNILLTTH